MDKQWVIDVSLRVATKGRSVQQLQTTSCLLQLYEDLHGLKDAVVLVAGVLRANGAIPAHRTPPDDHGRSQKAGPIGDLLKTTPLFLLAVSFHAKDNKICDARSLMSAIASLRAHEVAAVVQGGAFMPSGCDTRPGAMLTQRESLGSEWRYAPLVVLLQLGDMTTNTAHRASALSLPWIQDVCR